MLDPTLVAIFFNSFAFERSMYAKKMKLLDKGKAKILEIEENM